MRVAVTIKINREFIENENTNSQVDTIKINHIEVFSYDENRKNIFTENIRKEKDFEILNNILGKKDPNKDDMTSSVSHLNNALLNAATKSFIPKKNIRKTKGRTARKHANKKWFSKECSKYRQVLRKYSRKLSSFPFDRNILHLFLRARAQYKSICRIAERQYRQYITNQLTNIGMNEPKR